MFELLDKGGFWLSEDTSQPNKGWNSVLPRICSWRKFSYKNRGFTFYFFNTNFDQVGTLARKESSELFIQKIKLIVGDSPILVMGDFNVDQISKSYMTFYDMRQLLFS